MAEATIASTEREAAEIAPWPGSHEMPQWTTGPLVDAPRLHLARTGSPCSGPGLLVGGSAIGGGEWLAGPAVTARYGGALMWLATLSILGQVFYNIEISRYTLYTGEPIFTGKFRTLPGPGFWLFIYLLLDFGAVFPYLAANAATPLAAVYLGHPRGAGDEGAGAGLGIGVFLLAMLPLIFGGKIYNTLKVVMTFKIVTVLGFLLFLACSFRTWDTWSEILTGFFRFGTVPLPVRDGDTTRNVFVSLLQGRGFPTIDFSTIAMLAAFAAIAGCGGLSNTPISNYTRDQGWGMGHHVGAIPSMIGGHDIELSHVGMVFESTKDSLVAGGTGSGTSCAINLSSGCRPASWAWRCPACCRCSSCRAARKSATGTPPA